MLSGYLSSLSLLLFQLTILYHRTHRLSKDPNVHRYCKTPQMNSAFQRGGGGGGGRKGNHRGRGEVSGHVEDFGL